MNWSRIISALAKKRDTGEHPPERITHVIRRVRRHKRRLRNAKRVPKVHIATPLHLTPQWQMMRQALERGDKIIAFDAEWQYQWPHAITELGVAVFENGTTTVHNVRVRSGAGKADRTTRFMTDIQAKNWLSQMFQGAGLLLGHALHNDRKKMAQWGWRLPTTNMIPLVDTGSWSRALNPHSDNSMSLVNFCARHGVTTPRAHVAGNDALMTLNVAMTLAQIEEPEYVCTLTDQAA